LQAAEKQLRKVKEGSILFMLSTTTGRDEGLKANGIRRHQLFSCKAKENDIASFVRFPLFPG
jgi:hypothetical protein